MGGGFGSVKRVHVSQEGAKGGGGGLREIGLKVIGKRESFFFLIGGFGVIREGRGEG